MSTDGRTGGSHPSPGSGVDASSHHAFHLQNLRAHHLAAVNEETPAARVLSAGNPDGGASTLRDEQAPVTNLAA